MRFERVYLAYLSWASFFKKIQKKVDVCTGKRKGKCDFGIWFQSWLVYLADWIVNNAH